MNFFAAIKGYLYAAIAIAVLGLIGWQALQIHDLEGDVVTAQSAQRKAEGDFATYRGTQAVKTAELTSTNLRLSAQIATNAAAAEKEKADALKIVSDRLDVATRELRNRPSRPTIVTRYVPGDASAPAPVAGCTASELYREDATVVIELAGERDRIVAELLEVRAKYDAARNAQAVAQTVIP